eukprot:1656104-Rhodomonas_salina.3
MTWDRMVPSTASECGLECRVVYSNAFTRSRSGCLIPRLSHTLSVNTQADCLKHGLKHQNAQQLTCTSTLTSISIILKHSHSNNQHPDPHSQHPIWSSQVIGGPAYASDLKKGDVILEVDGKKATDPEILDMLVGGDAVGSRVLEWHVTGSAGVARRSRSCAWPTR